MSNNKAGSDFTFSSSAEVKTFVRAKLGMPDSEKKGLIEPRIADFRGLNGELVAKQTNGIQNFSYQLSKNYLFRTLFNPVDYDGRTWRDIKASYKTNELGFFIGFAFFICLGWSFAKYRRYSILEQKKRFVYQQYKKKKFIEESLRLKTREELISAEQPRLEYREYFKK